MLTLLNEYNRNDNKIKAAKLKCRAAIMHIDKKRGPPHARRSSLADWLIGCVVMQAGQSLRQELLQSELPAPLQEFLQSELRNMRRALP